MEARRGNDKASMFAQAEEIVVHIKGSKTDQYNVGCTRNQYATNRELCPVAAMAMYEKHFPHRVRGSEARMPLARWSDGSYVTRSEVQTYLEVASIADGGEPGDVGSHSLRVGGATAMYHVVKDLAKVRRFGRWATDTFHIYLWESHEPMRDIGLAMAEDESELVTPKK